MYIQKSPFRRCLVDYHIRTPFNYGNQCCIINQYVCSLQISDFDLLGSQYCLFNRSNRLCLARMEIHSFFKRKCRRLRCWLYNLDHGSVLMDHCFGSEPDSYFGKFGPAYYGNTVGIVGTQQRRHQPTQAPFEMTGDKTILTDSAAPYGTTNSTHSYNNYDHSHIATVNATSPTHPATATVQPTAIGTEMPQPHHTQNNQSNNVVYGEKVQALHAYHANPDDPNELSFDKGETLDIVDRNGNWWQARKADGTIGIIPSNYFGTTP
ncbi:unnamed protein product [Mucor hiemalis]